MDARRWPSDITYIVEQDNVNIRGMKSDNCGLEVMGLCNYKHQDVHLNTWYS